MIQFDELNEPVVLAPIGRKIKNNSDDSLRSKLKKARYSGDGKVASVVCLHKSPACMATTLTEDDLNFAHNQLYSTVDKVKQDATLLSYMNIDKCARHRKKVDDISRRNNREISVKYFTLSARKEKIPVCKASFMSIYGVKKDRLANIAKYWTENGVIRPENRGGARNIDQTLERKKAIHDHITTSSCRASHYARRGTPGRKFLPSDLNVKKMYELFKEQNHQQVSYSLYYSTFMYDFNLAFGHPAVDICSSCLKFKFQIKDSSLSDDVKRESTAMYMLHRRRARKFYESLNEVGDSYTFCFDIMENLVLPKSPIGQTYYSRQLYMYVFGIVRNRGRNMPQGKDDIHLFTWLESQNRKDSNMVASALNHFLTSVVGNGLQTYTNLRFISDSCFGQNKNINVVSMLCAVRKQHFPKLNIDYTFPARGHSFLPADLVFGRIEQDIRKQNTILLPDEYITILEKHGNVHVYGEDWECQDYKLAASINCKQQRSFKISEVKVLRINSDRIGFKQVFGGEFCDHAILKQGRKWEQYKPAVISNINCVKPAKKDDVLKLLGEIGAADGIREFYNCAFNNIVQHNVGGQDLEDSDSDEERPMREIIFKVWTCYLKGEI